MASPSDGPARASGALFGTGSRNLGRRVRSSTAWPHCTSAPSTQASAPSSKPCAEPSGSGSSRPHGSKYRETCRRVRTVHRHAKELASASVRLPCTLTAIGTVRAPSATLSFEERLRCLLRRHASGGAADYRVRRYGLDRVRLPAPAVTVTSGWTGRPPVKMAAATPSSPGQRLFFLSRAPHPRSPSFPKPMLTSPFERSANCSTLSAPRELQRASVAFRRPPDVRLVTLIDGLDENWDGSDISAQLVSGLLTHCATDYPATTAVSFVFLRENMYRRVRELAPRWDRIEGYFTFLTWTTEQLEHLVLTRLRACVRVRGLCVERRVSSPHWGNTIAQLPHQPNSVETP